MGVLAGVGHALYYQIGLHLHASITFLDPPLLLANKLKLNNANGGWMHRMAWHQCKNQLDPHKNGRADAGMNYLLNELSRWRASLILWLGLCRESVARVDGQSINQRRGRGGGGSNNPRT